MIKIKDCIGKMVIVQVRPQTAGNYEEWKFVEVSPSGALVKVKMKDKTEWIATTMFGVLLSEGGRYKIIEILKTKKKKPKEFGSV